MNTNIMAMSIAFMAVVGLIISLGGLNLLIGVFNTFFGKPRLTFLKSQFSKNGFAFLFEWNEAKWPITINLIRVRLYNPFGNPSQLEVTKSFDEKNSSFCLDLNMGPGFVKLCSAQGFDEAVIQIEVSSQKDGMSFQYEMKGWELKKKLKEAVKTVEEVKSSQEKETTSERKAPVYGIVPKDMIADTVPGKGPMLKLATNPMFAGQISTAHLGPAGGGQAKEEIKQENFSVEKVWIAPGCIVCNACEDIFPEVFDVQADTCLIRPNPPLNDGLRIQEAAEACPVEVIKFVKAAAVAS